jgi:hypothetical protein
MIAGPETHDVTVKLFFNPKEPNNIYWDWDDGVSGCDDVDDFLESVFPWKFNNEIEAAKDLLEEDDLSYMSYN